MAHLSYLVKESGVAVRTASVERWPRPSVTPDTESVSVLKSFAVEMHAFRPRCDRVTGDPHEIYDSGTHHDFADRLTEEITSRLTTISSISTISRTTALSYKGSTKPLREIATLNPEAHTAYLQGRFSLAKSTEAGSTEAIAFFTKAVAKDPAHARAYAGLADAYGSMPFHPGSKSPSAVANDNAVSAAHRTIALDSTLSEAHVSLAGVITANWRWLEAERSGSTMQCCDWIPTTPPRAKGAACC